MNRESRQDIKKGFASKGVFPHKWAFTLLIPLRNFFLSAEKLIERLHLNDNFNVLEVGPGPGYFSVPIARKLKSGKLFLADIQPEMLQYARKRLEKRKIENVEYHLCNGKTFDFKDDSFDVIFLVTVLGEVENKELYISDFYRMLKKDGIVSVSELGGDPDKMSVEELSLLFSKFNFIIRNQYGTKRNFTINFCKGRESDVMA